LPVLPGASRRLRPACRLIMAHGVRRVVKAVGTTVAVIIGLGAPLGFGAAEYAEFRFDLRREAERTAAQVVEQISEIGPLWPHEAGRLREILASADAAASQDSREALLNSRGVLMVGQDREVQWPQNHVKVPVRAGEQLIGWLERQESARPILEEMGVVALISGLFGIAAFFGFRTLPLRVLDRTFARLEAGHQVLREREADLREQYLIRDAALNTMSQGLSMFDADWRLVICNQRYAKLYDLPPELTEPGTPFAAIVEHRIATNNFVGTAEEYRRITACPEIHPATLLRGQRDGRVIEIVQEPSRDGGWVATHEDITQRKRVEAQVREQNATLREQDRQLRKQNIWLDAALNNMSQGLCMFDAEGYLVVCNRRFADLYQLPETLTQPGTPLEAILAHRMERGFYGPTPEVFLHQVRLRVASTQRHVELVEQLDGRVIQLTHEPVADGGWVATHEDITERRRADARIAYLATHDPLTDLPNRVLFRDKLDKAIADAQHGSSFAVHCLDLDRFKEVNDTLGHPIGDALLIQVATRLRAALHTTDAVARLGGDEFALIQCELQRPEQASALAEQIIELIAQPFDIDGHEIVVATSIGVAIAPEDGVDPDQLLKSADLALYRAKSDGRGTFRFFEKEMDARLHARRRFESELRAALGNGEMEVYYQPLFNLQRNTISGFEALLRWHHPERGMVSPEEFIPSRRTRVSSCRSASGSCGRPARKRRLGRPTSGWR
jgi:diguanylate cyclase (GGDEF)-like protein